MEQIINYIMKHFLLLLSVTWLLGLKPQISQDGEELFVHVLKQQLLICIYWYIGRNNVVSSIYLTLYVLIVSVFMQSDDKVVITTDYYVAVTDCQRKDFFRRLSPRLSVWTLFSLQPLLERCILY